MFPPSQRQREHPPSAVTLQGGSSFWVYSFIGPRSWPALQALRMRRSMYYQGEIPLQVDAGGRERVTLGPCGQIHGGLPGWNALGEAASVNRRK